MNINLQTEYFNKMLKKMAGIKEDLYIRVSDDEVTFIKENTTTTLKIRATHIDAYEDGETILPMETLSILRKIKDSQLNITDKEIKTHNKVIKYKQKQIRKLMREPAWEEAFKTTEKELKRMLEVKYAVAKDTARPILTGVYFYRNETCGLDGYRLSIREGAYASDKSFVVNKDTIEILERLLDGARLDREVIAQINGGNGGKVKFSIGSNIEVIGRLLEGTPFNYKQIVPDSCYYVSRFNLEDLKGELNFINNIKIDVLTLRFTRNELIMTASQCKKESVRKGTCKPTLISSITSNLSCITKIDENKEFVINCDPKYLSESLKTYTDTEFIELKMTSGFNPIIITDNDDWNLELVLPMRISEV